MKMSDVRALTSDQIKDEILKLRKEQLNLRFQRASGQLEKTNRIRQIRRDIARLKRRDDILMIFHRPLEYPGRLPRDVTVLVAEQIERFGDTFEKRIM